MRLEAPAWWYEDKPAPWLLRPLGAAYGLVTPLRFALTRPCRAAIPVICVGNLTLGGAGKTPAALALGTMLRKLGLEPAFLSRGYGGALPGPHVVDPARDTAAAVGDEPLLLARHALTVVARDRCAGARRIEAEGASAIIMDDGFQNPSLAKDLALVVIDGATGIGNGAIFPAGPLRASLTFQLARADALIIAGRGPGGEALGRVVAGRIPVLNARITPAGDTTWLRDAPVWAFSGIARPEKFFATLRALGARLEAARAFPDHHRFSEAEAAGLLQGARKAGAQLVTTEKDWLRLPDDASAAGQLRAAAQPLPVRLEFDGESEKRLRALLAHILPGTPA